MKWLMRGGRDRFYMTVSIAIRMAGGLAVFVVLARTLGPATYGLFAITFAYASLVSLITDFGFGTQLAQQIGACPEKAGPCLRVALRGKSWLVAIVLPILPLVYAFSDLTNRDILAIIFVSGGVVVNSYADLALAAVRSAGHYRQEAEELIASTAAMLLTLAACFFAHADFLEASFAFTIAKIIHLALVLLVISRIGIRIIGEPWLNLPSVFAGFRTGLPFAIDNILTMLSSQIDVLMVGKLFGLEATGIYQIGSRLVLGEIALAAALTGVHLPKAAAAVRGDPAAYQRYERLMMIEFSALGAVLAVALLVIGPFAVNHFLGASYAEANLLWPGFAVFVLLRFLAASIGICFLVRARLGIRIANQLVSLVVTICLILLSAKFGELSGVPWAIAGGTGAMVLVYAGAYLKLKNRP